MFGIGISSTNFIGSPNGFGWYLTTMAVLGSGLWLVSGNKESQRALPTGVWGVVARIGIFLTVASAIVVLLGLDFWFFWVAIIIGIGMMFGFAIIRANEFPQTGRFVLPMSLFVIALLFLFLPSFFTNRFSLEVAPSYKASISIARQSMGQHAAFFGSGPGTFTQDYALFAPLDINQSRFWDIRFDRSSSHVLTMLATMGIANTVVFLVFVIWLFILALKLLITEKAHDEWKMTFVAFSAWLVVTFSLFVYSSNMTVLFLFWLLSAVLVSQASQKAKTYTFSQSPRFGLLTAFLFVLVNVGLITVIFVSIARYTAEIAFAHAVSIDRQNGSLDDIILNLDRSARLNKLSDIYYRNLGNALLLRTGDALQDPSVESAQLQTLIASSINASKRATELGPENVVNWALLGDIYREVSPLVANADAYSVTAYKRASELSPNNPKFLAMLGRAYIVRADQLGVLAQSEDATVKEEATKNRAEALRLAVESLTLATNLKGDYAPAHYQLALAYERQGNIAEAVSRLKALKPGSPNDIGLALQLGLLYLQQGKTDEAQVELERAVEIAPNYSNAHWYLSAVYEDQGKIEEAIKEVEIIKGLNPDNTLVDQRLERLKNGGKATTNVLAPIEEGTGTVTDVPNDIVTEPPTLTP